MAPKAHVCLDCKKMDPPPPTVRKIWTKEGVPPRCGQHGRAVRTARRARSADLRVESFAGITAAQYWELYEQQGGTCAFPRCNATGKTKRLAVDHDHRKAALQCDHDPKTEACRNCIRGLLCGPHNYELIGKYEVDLRDALNYLQYPPAPLVLLASPDPSY
jgi:Recombination endonuclease VII